MHGSDALERQVVVHHREHALLHLAAVPGVEDDLLAIGEVEDDGGLGVEAQLLVVLDLGLGGVEDHEVRLEVLQLFLGGADEHVLHEMGLPGDFHDEADGHAGVLVGAAEGVHDEQALVGQLLDGDVLAGGPGLFGSGMVVVLVALGGPPHGVLGGLVHDDELVLGGAAGVDAGHDVHSAEFADLALFIAFQAGLGLFREQLLERGVIYDLGGTSDAILGQIELFHQKIPPTFLYEYYSSFHAFVLLSFEQIDAKTCAFLSPAAPVPQGLSTRALHSCQRRVRAAENL